ncbi:MAG TPA: acetate kinase [Dermatophilaceae bacterium]|nr:acetate kinase [Dermatophilaceae bacterium]
MSAVLVVNAGSSSLKYELLDPVSRDRLATGLVERIGGDARRRHRRGRKSWEEPVAGHDHRAAFDALLDAFRRHGPTLDPASLLAVGHRVVHGGERFTAPVVIDDAVLDAVEDLVPLAPLHNPANLLGIRLARRAFGDVPHVAVFDTAFHATMPPAAYTYAVPAEWRERHAVRRYGFHGTSHAYVSRRTAELLGRDPVDVNLVVLHLGNGASACAVAGGRSVDTSMGLTPLEGLVMGTRSGDVDPSLPAHLARTTGLGLEDYDRALNRESGLLALSGSSDWRDVVARRAAGDADAALAFDVTVHRLVTYVGGYAALLARLDALAFTGGIGEHSPDLREAVIDRLGVLGLELDRDANAGHEGTERRVTTDASPVAAFVVPTDEELEIARECVAVLGGA